MDAQARSRTDEGVRYAAWMPVGDVNDPRIRSLQWVRPGSRVLEIGCGHGAVTRYLAHHLHCSVVAVDVDPRCGESVRGVAERFVCGDASSEAIQGQIEGSYDYVLLMDVLEHLQSPDRVLSALASKVGPKAAFVITLPNVVVWHVRLPILRGHFEYAETGTLDRTHLRFFTPVSACRMVADAGFSIEATESTWNVPHLSSLWSIAQIARVTDLEAKVRRRFARRAEFVLRLFAIQRVLNEHGWTQFIDGVARKLLRAAPTVFTNHILILAEPATSSGRQT